MEGAEWVPGEGEPAMPGDPAGVSAFAGLLELRAVELRDQSDAIGRLEPDWQGAGADEFLVLKDTLPTRMGLAADRLEAVASTLHDYADELGGATVDAENAVGDATLALNRWHQAEALRLGALTSATASDMTLAEWVDDNPAQPDFLGDLDTAEQDLEDAWGDYTAAYTRRQMAADACEAAITTAIDDTSSTGTLNDTHPSHLALDDAAELQRLLDELGIEVDSYGASVVDVANPDSRHYELYQELYSQLELMAGRLDEPSYAVALFNELGADGAYQLFGTVEALQVWSPQGAVGWDVEGDLLMPFLGGFADATNDLDSRVLDEIVLSAADEDRPGRLGLLGLMLGADGVRYEPGFVADAADMLLVAEADRWAESSEGSAATLARPGWDALHLNSPHLAAYKALGENLHAAHAFASKGEDNMAALLRPSTEHALDTETIQAIEVATAEVVTGLATHTEDQIREGSIDIFVNWIDNHGEVATQIYDPLITGVDYNIAYLDRLINNSLTEQDRHDDYHRVQAFLRTLMGGPEDAPQRLFNITSQYNLNRIAEITELGAPDRRDLLVSASRLHGLTNRAYINARVSLAWTEHMPDSQTGSIPETLLFFTLGEIPYLGTGISAASAARDIIDGNNSNPGALNEIGQETRDLHTLGEWQINAMVINAEIEANTTYGAALRDDAASRSLVNADGTLRSISELINASNASGGHFEGDLWSEYIEWIGSLSDRRGDMNLPFTADEDVIMRGFWEGSSNAEGSYE